MLGDVTTARVLITAGSADVHKVAVYTMPENDLRHHRASSMTLSVFAQLAQYAVQSGAQGEEKVKEMAELLLSARARCCGLSFMATVGSPADADGVDVCHAAGVATHVENVSTHLLAASPPFVAK